MKYTGRKVVIRDWALPDIEVFVEAHKGRKLWMEYDGPYYKKPDIEEVLKKVQVWKKEAFSNDEIISWTFR